MQLKKDQGDIPPSTSKKQEIKQVPAEYIQLPPRDRIFMVYNDPQLEKAVMDRIREDLRADGKYTPEQEKYLVFPALPVISPPGIAYQPKTVKYEPHKLLIEPGYVVHRRLHFEEKNAERIGLGPSARCRRWCLRGTSGWTRCCGRRASRSECVYGFWDTSAGKCLPGSTSPYYLYPPGFDRDRHRSEPPRSSRKRFFLFPCKLSRKGENGLV